MNYYVSVVDLTIYFNMYPLVKYNNMFVIIFVSIFLQKVSSGDLHASHTLMSRLVLTPCVNDEDCRDFINGTCVDAFCKCNGSNICIERRKILVNKLGESCYSSDDCINVDNSICSEDNHCVCKENSVPTSDERKCLLVSNGVGDSCEEDIQCRSRTPHSKCHENICVCRQHMHEHKGACYRNVGFGEMCTISEECSHMKHSVCKNNICSCTDGHVGSGNECIEAAKGIKSICSRNIQCMAVLGRGSECMEGRCQCSELYHYKESQKKCVRDLLLGDLCSFHSDCHQPGQDENRLECFLGNCVCREPYTEEDGYCISSARLTTHLGIMTILFCFVVVKIIS